MRQVSFKNYYYAVKVDDEYKYCDCAVLRITGKHLCWLVCLKRIGEE